MEGSVAGGGREASGAGTKGGLWGRGCWRGTDISIRGSGGKNEKGRQGSARKEGARGQRRDPRGCGNSSRRLRHCELEPARTAMAISTRVS
ncbi:hypothetical protein C8Q73DRAFT_160331 [Cubamyces lactineus]|nr:hypothetical protein C8Q73DRAFT_160331 [Cubamyces lactineus]